MAVSVRKPLAVANAPATVVGPVTSAATAFASFFTLVTSAPRRVNGSGFRFPISTW